MSQENEDIRWYAVYTKPRNEKKVYNQLVEDGFECYLPLVRTLRVWSDRKKWKTLPLFPSYLFVHIHLNDYLKVLKTDGVVKFVRFADGPQPIPDKQIMAIKAYEKSGDIITEDDEEIIIGDKVEVVHGKFKGLFGNIAGIGRRKKVKIVVEGINHSVYLYIPKSFLKKLSGHEAV